MPNIKYSPLHSLHVKNKAKFIEDIRKQFVGKISNQQLDAYLAVSKTNQNELKLQNDKII